MSCISLMDNDSEFVTQELVHKWESFINTSVVQNAISTADVEPYLAEAYKGNFSGLLHNEFKIPNSALYINTRINDLKSSLDYDGKKTIKLLHPDVAFKLLTSIQE